MSKGKIFVRLIGVLLIASLLMVGCSTSSKTGTNDLANKPDSKEKIVIRYSIPDAATKGVPAYDVALQLKEKIEKYTDGQVDFQIYPGGQLGSEQKNVPDVQNGIIQMAQITAGNMTQFSPALGIYDLPYIFKNREEAYKVIDALKDDLNKLQIKESETTTIAWLEQGFRNLTNSKKPVTSLADLKGLKIRVPSNEYVIEVFKSWGANPSPISWDETFSAVQQKVVDGQENPYSSIYQSKMYEVQKYVTDIHYKLWLGVIIVNDKWLQEQPANVRDAIIKAGNEVTQFNREDMVSKEKELRQMLQDKGMVMSGAPTDEDEWMKAAMSIWPKFYGKITDITLLDKAMTLLGRQKT